jgi:hypothetical protein
MGADYNTIRITGTKMVERSQQAQRYNGNDPNKAAQDLLADFATLFQDAFPAITRTDSNYETIQSEIAGLSWPTRAADEKLARDWWNLYRQRTKEFGDVYIAVGAYLSNDSPTVRPTLLAQFAAAMVKYVKTSDDFYSTGTSLGIESCR